MRITFWGAARTVTGSCHIVEAGDLKILLDCGLFQGHAADRNLQPFPFRPQDIHY